ncbi:MAG: cell division protein FtsZ [Spartobacteria bacterium]|nr:cell division protein FtsZ [Spartobacteria bacterium]
MTQMAIVKLVGVGGAGSHILNRLVAANTPSPAYLLAVNTDSGALALGMAPQQLQIGRILTRGLGAGGNPEIGRRAAEESCSDLLASIGSVDIAVVTAGMGGGTGTGAAPRVAAAAREAGAIVIGIVSLPFTFEGRRRGDQAQIGVAAMRSQVDLLLIIRNDSLLRMVESRSSMQEAFQAADAVVNSIITRLAAMALPVSSTSVCAAVAEVAVASPIAIEIVPVDTGRVTAPMAGLAPSLGNLPRGPGGLEPTL